MLSTFSPSFDVLLGCSTYDPTLLGNIALKFVFYPGQSGTPTCRACDGVTCPHLHLLSPPHHFMDVLFGRSTLFRDSGSFTPGEGRVPTSRVVMGALGASSHWCNSYRSTMQPVGGPTTVQYKYRNTMQTTVQCFNALPPVSQLHREGK